MPTEGLPRAGSNLTSTLLEPTRDGARGGPPGAAGLDEKETLPGRSFPNGCHIAEVEIDPTPATQVVRYTVVDDFGNLMNPMLAEGQVHGGVAQGIGQAITEHVVYDEDGQLLTATLHGLRHAAGRRHAVDRLLHRGPVPSTANPIGMKGCGEAGTVGALRRGGQRGAGRALAAGHPAGRHAVHAVAGLGDAAGEGRDCGGIAGLWPGSGFRLPPPRLPEVREPRDPCDHCSTARCRR
jgi:hypothetical protein